MGLPREAMQVLWRVQPEFLQAAFDEVDAGYGSLEGYLREGLGPAARPSASACARSTARRAPAAAAAGLSCRLPRRPPTQLPGRCRQVCRCGAANTACHGRPKGLPQTTAKESAMPNQEQSRDGIPRKDEDRPRRM